MQAALAKPKTQAQKKADAAAAALAATAAAERAVQAQAAVVAAEAAAAADAVTQSLTSSVNNKNEVCLHVQGFKIFMQKYVRECPVFGHLPTLHSILDQPGLCLKNPSSV